MEFRELSPFIIGSQDYSSSSSDSPMELENPLESSPQPEQKKPLFLKQKASLGLSFLEEEILYDFSYQAQRSESEENLSRHLFSPEPKKPRLSRQNAGLGKISSSVSRIPAFNRQNAIQIDTSEDTTKNFVFFSMPEVKPSLKPFPLPLFSLELESDSESDEIPVKSAKSSLVKRTSSEAELAFNSLIKKSKKILTVFEKIVNNLLKAADSQKNEDQKELKVDLSEEIPDLISHRNGDFLLEVETIRIFGTEVIVACTKGMRPTMEDRHIAQEFIFSIASKVYQGQLYVVCDGHGGDYSSDYVSKKLPTALKKELMKYDSFDQEVFSRAALAVFSILNLGCIKAGTTVNMNLIVENQIFVANVGDSRCAAKIGNQIIQLSDDARLSNPRFSKKVTKLGGPIITDNNGTLRIGIKGLPNMGLAIAGALGDHAFKDFLGNQYVPHVPQITFQKFNEDGFLLIACDGFWDVCSTDYGMNLIEQLLQTETKENAAKRLIYHAMKLSNDNVSLILVPLRKSSPQ